MPLTLEYTGSSGIVGSYSGAVVDPGNISSSNLKLFPLGQGSGKPSIALYLPFFNGNWWSVMVNFVYGTGYTLTAKSKNSDYVASSTIQYSDTTTSPYQD